MDTSSRVVKVIETRNGDEISYHTLEGLFIGGFKGGERAKQETPSKPVKSFAGVVKSLTPEQMRREKEKEVRKLQDPKQRLKRLIEEVA